MRLRGMLSCWSAVVLVAGAAMGQGLPASDAAAVKVPALDVISVKPNKGGDRGSSWGPTADGVMGKNITPHVMLMNAYHVNESQLIGEPKWVDEEHFDFTGKVASEDAATVAKLTPDQKHVFFEQVLKERFGLVAHHETRELPEYALVPAKGGVKLVDGNDNPSASPGMKHSPGSYSWGSDGPAKKVEWSAAPIDPLLGILANETGRMVVDKTGLTGKYSFTLKWRPAMAQAGADAAADSTPDLFTAIQEQLGLKLEPVKGPVDVVVIDHLERPAEN